MNEWIDCFHHLSLRPSTRPSGSNTNQSCCLFTTASFSWRAKETGWMKKTETHSEITPRTWRYKQLFISLRYSVSHVWDAPNSSGLFFSLWIKPVCATFIHFILPVSWHILFNLKVTSMKVKSIEGRVPAVCEMPLVFSAIQGSIEQQILNFYSWTYPVQYNYGQINIQIYGIFGIPCSYCLILCVVDVFLICFNENW